MNKLLLQIVIRQVGTAHSFIPLYQSLCKKGLKNKIEILCLTTHEAHFLLDQKKIPYTPVSSFKDAQQYLNKGIRLLFTGSSDFFKDDHLFWDWAKKNQIPSWAYVEQWIGFALRFTSSKNSKNKFNCTPDKVLVIDSLAKKEIIQEGMDPKKIIVAGNPAFDIFTKIKTNELKCKKKYKVIFISEPFKKDFPKIKNFNELTAIEDLISILDRIHRDKKIRFKLDIRPHPYYNEKTIRDFLKVTRPKSIEINIRSGDKIEAVKGADLVIGMTSILLFESYLMRKNTVCYIQKPFRPNSFTQIAPQLKVFTEKQQLHKYMLNFFLKPKKIRLSKHHQQRATLKFTELLLNELNFK